MTVVMMVVIAIVVVLVINMIVTVNICGSEDSGAGGCVSDSSFVSDKCNSYSKYGW